MKEKTIYQELYFDDCITIMPKLKSKSIDLTITSPPYDNARDFKNFNKYFIFEKIAKELYRLTKKGGIVVWIVNDVTKNFCETLTSFKQAIYFVEECKFNLLDTMIYSKLGGPPTFPTLRRYSPRFEYMFIFSKGKPKTFNGIKDVKNKSTFTTKTRRLKNGSMTYPEEYSCPDYRLRNNVWNYKTSRMNTTLDTYAFYHPALFPEQLAKDHIISWSNEKDIVFDPLMGGGTTGKMAVSLNRNFIGIEIVEEYYKIARYRIKKEFERRLTL